MTEGLLLFDKPKGRSSFWLIIQVRKRLKIRKVGHAGTLDPFATGVMVILVGRNYTRLSNQFLNQDKQYRCRLRLGQRSTTGDPEGELTFVSADQPLLAEVMATLLSFQGTRMQTPPMYSAKKIGGQKLYTLARQGITVERPPTPIRLETELLHYTYPFLDIDVTCSKGAYMRVLAEEIGEHLGCGAYLEELQRLRSGPFLLSECMDEGTLLDEGEDVTHYLRSARCEQLAFPKSG